MIQASSEIQKKIAALETALQLDLPEVSRKRIEQDLKTLQAQLNGAVQSIQGVVEVTGNLQGNAVGVNWGAIHTIIGAAQLRPDSASSPNTHHEALVPARQIKRILLLAANPTNTSRLRLGEEFREIHEKLQLAPLRNHFNLHQRLAVRAADISQALLEIQPQIVHFSGHGGYTGELCFEDKLGQCHPIQPDALAALFEQFASQVYCVVLNACYSEAQAQAISQHINYVIGMNQNISDQAAIAFVVGFYQALGVSRSFEEAYRFGCTQIRLQGLAEHLTPIFIKKVGKV